MDSSAPNFRSKRELAHRSDDGIDVTLYWCPGADRLTVCVCDERRGAYFEIEPEANNGLDAFYHPYAYASAGRASYEGDLLAA
jgi:hypothetical protein